MNCHRSFSALVLVLIAGLSQASPITYFSFDSSADSAVGRGYTDYFVSPDTGWSIQASRNNDNGVSFNIDRDAGEDPAGENYYWTLDFAAPFNTPITPDLYPDIARFPFQDYDQPGLSLKGNHRGNNRLGGFFEVLEAQYSPTGEVLRFSADFTQYGDELTTRWIVGEIRYNASPIPEPSSALLLGALMMCVDYDRCVCTGW